VYVIGQAVGAALQPVVIGVLSVAVFALLRLVTPTVRWRRRLKQDSEVVAALVAGKERDEWQRRVTAQAERLRIYTENTRTADQAIAWGSLVLIVLLILTAIDQAAAGWPALSQLGPEWPLSILGFAFAIWLVSRLITGRATNLRASDRYPKYRALRRHERRNSERRAAVDAKAERRARESVKAAKRRGRAAPTDAH
jgi:uncharacterized integral membrane protein